MQTETPRFLRGPVPGHLNRPLATLQPFLARPGKPTVDIPRLERELEGIAELCRRYDAYAVTDEIYEHIYYEGEHIPIATLPGMRDRTVTISGASKTFSITGWRGGTIGAPPPVTHAIRTGHDFPPVAAPAPLPGGAAARVDIAGPGYHQ